jgi:hypothetical protein
VEKQLQPEDETAQQLTCENCGNAFKQHVEPEMAICVPHLKLVRLKNTQACELYSITDENNQTH